MAYTMVDIARRNLGDPGERSMMEEVMKLHPEFTLGTTRTVDGIGFYSLVRTAIGATSFRNAGEGTALTDDTYENRYFETYIMEPIWRAEKAIADRSEDGARAVIADMGTGKLESAMQSVATQIYYGTDTKGFAGLKSVVNSSLQIDAGSSGSATTEIWALKWGARDCQLLLGNGGSMDFSEVDEVVIDDPNDSDKKMVMYQQYMDWYPGFAVKGVYSCGVIKNIDASNKCTDAHMAELLAKFVDLRHSPPDMFMMNPYSQWYLQSGRTATTEEGIPAPFPGSNFQIPIYLSQGIARTTAAW